MTEPKGIPVPSVPPSQAETLRASRWFEVEGKDCTITIEPRPMYCDRGHWIAKLHPKPSALPGDFDHADGWPRYFFDWQRMVDELAAWLDWREQALTIFDVIKSGSQAEVARAYALAIRQTDKHTSEFWREVNAAIVERWSLKTLTRIKREAWRSVESDA